MKPISFYRLTTDVNNPTPDRRRRGDFNAEPVWKAGARLRLSAYPGERRRLSASSGYSHQCVFEGDEAFERLMWVAVPVPPTSKELLDLYDISAEDVVHWMVTRKVLNSELLSTIAEDTWAEFAAKEEAEKLAIQARRRAAAQTEQKILEEQQDNWLGEGADHA